MKKIILFVLICAGASSLSAQSGGQLYADDSAGSTPKEQTSCWQGCISLWLYSNLIVNYQRYPYENPSVSNFIIYERYMPNELQNRDQRSQFISFDSVAEEKVFPGRPYFYNADFQYGETSSGNKTMQGSLRGRFFRIIGPELEYRRVNLDGKDLNYYALGVNIPIFQFSGFMPELYVQSSHFSGVAKESGITYGFQLFSYPFKPVSFMARYGWVRLGQYNFHDKELRLGLLMWRLEPFVSWRSMRSGSINLGGYTGGVKVWF